MTKHWPGKSAMAMATLLLASAMALPTVASAHDRHDRGWHGRGHYDRGWHDHYRHDRGGHWSGGRWVAGAIVAGAVIGLVDDALSPPPRVVYERPVYRRPVRVVYEEPVVTRRVVETRTVYVEQAPPTRYVGYYGD
ncbi:hypothetical protein J7I44_14830 [Frateuria sp. MAH-13]|uniref:Transmembrane protein n=1 Tax=Frateuria flava TaxID=2821489 RepID=A0ABS4DR99_9GAMM|nr:hypothetical protein [Frateuria flava]MBP1475586.1 hypothetical protein [Frateuria flava]